MANAAAASAHLICGNRNYSSWSLRAWLSLRRAGVDPKVTVLPMDTDEFAQRIAAYSPTRRVPVLWLGEELIWDSLAIAETVNERFASGSLWPDDPAMRARGRAMAAEMHSGFPHLRHQLPMNCRARDREIDVDASCMADVQRISELWSAALDGPRGDGDWLLGPWSIADAMFAPVAVRFTAYQLELPEVVRDYVERWMADPDLREWIALAKEETWVIPHEEAGRETS